MSVVATSMQFSPEQFAEVDTWTLDMEEMLGESLLDKKILQEKEHLGHKAIKLLQRRTSMLTSTASQVLRKFQAERTELERQLQGEIATCHCQFMAAQVDVEVWKRRTGLLQLRLSSVQEDMDMYAMRVRLLESEICQESAAKAHAQAGLSDATGELGTLKEQLAATVAEYKASQKLLEAQLAAAAKKFEAAQKEAAAAAQLAEQRLTQTQEELAAAKPQLKEALQAAAAAGERADELEWRLKRQEATLAERLRMADEAKQATDGLSEEGLRAVREKAAFLGEELRAQLAESRDMLSAERKLRREAEAAAADAHADLSRRLQQTSADISALRDQVSAKNAKIRSLEDACQQQQTKAAMDVVTSLVGDLNPPDTEPRRRPSHADAGAAEAPVLASVPEADTLAVPAPQQQQAGQPGDAAAEAGKERDPAKKHKRGSKGQAAQAEQLPEKPPAAGNSAEPAGKPAQEPAGDSGVKRGQARAAKKQAKAGNDSVETQPAEAEPASKRAEKASKKRKAEERCEATAKSANAGEQEVDESAGDVAPAGRRGRPGRARATKAPYWMGAVAAAADDSLPAGDDSPGTGAAEADSDGEAPKQAAKRHRHAEPDQAAQAAEEVEPAKPKRARKKAQEEIAEVAEEMTETKEEKKKPGAAAGKARRKLVRAGEAEAMAAAAEQLADAVEAAEPMVRRGPQRKKAKAAAAAAEGAVPHDHLEGDATQADDFGAGSGPDMQVERDMEPDAAVAPAQQESSQGPAESAAAAVAVAEARRVSHWERSRPPGVSKVDLTTVWGHTRTPQADATSAAPAGAPCKGPTETEKEKENSGAAAAAGHAIIKPVPAGRSRFGSQSEANPLAALNPEVLAAAVKVRGAYVSGLNAPKRLGEVAPGKRRLLPAPKPMGSVAALPRDMLFGQNFQIPRLSQ